MTAVVQTSPDKSADAYAAWNETAPIPVWSGEQPAVPSQSGREPPNNAALHRIAVTQLRIHPPAQELVARHLAAGKTNREALRILKRRLSDRVQKTMLHDTLHHTQAAPARAA